MSKNLLVLTDCGENVPTFDPEFNVTALPVDASFVQRISAIRDAEIIIGEPTLEELKHAHSLKWLQMTWAGADRYLHGGFPSGVSLTTASGAFGQTIAEHSLALILALARRLPSYARSRKWEDLGGEKRLYGTTALIYGCGDIGSHIATLLKSFQIRTVGVCRNPRKPRKNFDILTTLDSAELFFSEAELVICALPHSEDTCGYFCEERLAALRNDCIFVNVGRGSLVDTQSLCRLLAKGKFFGVGLDVVDPEPLPDKHPLRNYSNVILTPHVAGIGFGHLKDTEDKIWAICKNNLRRYLAGEPLENQVIFP